MRAGPTSQTVSSISLTDVFLQKVSNAKQGDSLHDYKFSLYAFFSGLCRGKAMVTYTKPQNREKEEIE